MRGLSLPACHQRSNSARLRLIHTGSRSACAPHTTPITEMFFTRMRLAGTAWIRPPAKPMISMRASQFTDAQRLVERIAANRIVDDVGTFAAGQLADAIANALALVVESTRRPHGPAPP